MKPKKKPSSADDLPVEPTTDEIVEMFKPEPLGAVSKLDLMLTEAVDEAEEEEEEEEEDDEVVEDEVDNYYVLYLLAYAHKRLGLFMPNWLRETHMKVLGKGGRVRGRSEDTEFTQILLLRQLCNAPLPNGSKLVEDASLDDDATRLREWWCFDRDARRTLQIKSDDQAKMTKLTKNIKAKLTKDELTLLQKLVPNVKL